MKRSILAFIILVFSIVSFSGTFIAQPVIISGVKVNGGESFL